MTVTQRQSRCARQRSDLPSRSTRPRLASNRPSGAALVSPGWRRRPQPPARSGLRRSGKQGGACTNLPAATGRAATATATPHPPAQGHRSAAGGGGREGEVGSPASFPFKARRFLLPPVAALADIQVNCEGHEGTQIALLTAAAQNEADLTLGEQGHWSLLLAVLAGWKKVQVLVSSGKYAARWIGGNPGQKLGAAIVGQDRV